MKSAQPITTGARGRTRRVAAEAPPVVTPKLTKLLQTKIVTPKSPSTDPRVLERERLVGALLAAPDRSTITRATEALLGAGHELPDTQEAHLQVLEHSDEARVRASIAALDALFAREPNEPVRRRPVLEQRLKRIEAFAEEPATREAATALRRKL